MLLLKFLLIAFAIGLFAGGGFIIVWDFYRLLRGLRAGTPAPALATAVRWPYAARLVAAATVPLLLGLSIVVVPSGFAAVRVSQVSGTLPGTLYAGTHFIVPLVQQVETYNVRDRVFSTAAADSPKRPEQTLKLQSMEGLPIGLGVSVRYRLDPKRLPYVHASLPQPVDTELVQPTVASVFRQTVPNYMVREVFSTKREEVRRLAAEAITRKLAADGILVKEVMVRDIVLPPEYAKGLEGLLLQEQENERLGIELEVKQKEVRAAELESDAAKVREVKQAEAQAQVTVLQAKAQADAMQYTLPLKEKQIQQTRLEAEARKEATVKNAEAMAQAKVIDSRAEVEKQGLMTKSDVERQALMTKAEVERQSLMAKAEEQRIRLIASADAERLRGEAVVLKDNPLLIQKIIAERLSDKVQIMMVPTDGKFFFANDVLKGSQAAMNLQK